MFVAAVCILFLSQAPAYLSWGGREGGGGGGGGGEDVGEEESKNNLFLVYTVSNLKHTSIANIFTNTTFPTTLSWFIPF